VAPSDATEKNCNTGAQLQSILYTTAQKDLGKFTSFGTFGAHKLVHSELFFRLDALAKALSVIATATWLAGWVAGCLSQPVLYQND